MTTTNPITGTNIPAAGPRHIPANCRSTNGFPAADHHAAEESESALAGRPTQFVSQLEGMSEVSSMQSMQSSLQASAVMSGTRCSGHSVLAPGSTAALTATGAIGGAVTRRRARRSSLSRSASSRRDR